MSLVPLIRQNLLNSQEIAKYIHAAPEKALLLLNDNVELTLKIYESMEKGAE